MAGVSLDMDTGPVKDLLDELLKKMGDLTPVMNEIGEIVVTQTKEAFESGTAPDGTPWKPTIRGGQILVNEGDLWNSINEQAFSDHVVIGSAKHYAAIHQLGGETGPRTIRPKNKKALFWPGAGHPMKAVRHPGSTIPARPFLPDEQSLDWDEIHDTVTRYLLP